ncbi:hypothetical protein F4604DRAFT_1688890 [Suillus subluteus]|nr:hypothetical protein F4604DRAFT_1688890 [Suillus subluteus]
MTYMYNHKPGVITGFEHTGSFSDLRLDLDFVCYVLSGRNIGPCYWPTKVSIDVFWPLSKEPLGYIAMNGHRGPLIKASGRANYEHPGTHLRFYLVDKKFTAKLVPWPYGHYNTIILDNLDEVMDNIVTEDFDDASFSQVCTEDYTTESFQHRSGQIYDFVPSSSALELTMALVPGPPSTQTPAMESFVFPGFYLRSCIGQKPTQSIMRTDHMILEYDPHGKPHYWAWTLHRAKRFHWHHLWEMYDHKPNTRLSDIRKIIGHCLTPGTDMNFCHDNDEGLARIIQMTVVLDQQEQCQAKSKDEALAVAFDALGCTLDKTGDAAVIKIYRRIEHLHGPHLIEIQAAA